MSFKRYLLPGEEQSDPAFRKELTRLSTVGLKAILWVCLGAPSFMLAVTAILNRVGYQSRLWIWPNLAIIGLGLAAAPFAFVGSLHSWARGAGSFVGYSVALIFMVAAVVAPDDLPGAVNAVPLNITLVMLVGIAALPLRPMQTLVLGLSMLSTWVAAIALFPEKTFVPDSTPLFLSSLVVIILICTGLTAVVYRQRSDAFQARQQILRSQARLALSESAAAQGRLAAALSHELNSPIGVLVSHLDTLSLIQKKSKGGERPVERLLETLEEAHRSATTACRRLSDVVGRMQRFTNLDRAEEAAVDMNSLLEDTIEILSSEIQKTAEIATMLEPLPRIRCRPQQMSAVISNLLLNSRDAIDGRGTIRVRSSARQGEVVIEVEDDGRGIPGEKLAHIFEPAFTVAEGRVSTSHWGLFNCRNVVTSLGGEIRIESVEGRGTKVTIVLPVSSRLDVIRASVTESRP